MKNYKIGTKALVSLICCTALALSVSCASESAALEKYPTPSEPKGPLKILAIGNSFTEDAVEQNLYQLFAAAGQEVIVAHMYHAGCNLEQHYQYVTNNEPEYSYRKNVGGVKTKTDGLVLLHALQDEEWDYVSIQQESGRSGFYETYTPYLPYLLKYIRDNVKGGKAKLVFHQVWAYDYSCNNGHFKQYDYDQMKMFNAILGATDQLLADHPSLLIVPCGTAIQNARTSFIGDAFNRDSAAHLEGTYGRYTAACTWYEAISGKSVVGNSFAPSTVDIMEKAVAQNAAHFAVQNPKKITELVGLRNPLNGSEEFDAPVYIDFGAAKSSVAKWFKTPPFFLNRAIYPKDIDDTYTPISISRITGFSDAYNGAEDLNLSDDLVIGGITYPKIVWEDGLLLKSGYGPGKVVLSGFDPDSLYDLTLLSLRYSQSSNARVSELSVEGASQLRTVEVSSNLKALEPGKDYSQYQVRYDSVAPSADGKITITVKCKAQEAFT